MPRRGSDQAPRMPRAREPARGGPTFKTDDEPWTSALVRCRPKPGRMAPPWRVRPARILVRIARNRVGAVTPPQSQIAVARQVRSPRAPRSAQELSPEARFPAHCGARAAAAARRRLAVRGAEARGAPVALRFAALATD